MKHSRGGAGTDAATGGTDGAVPGKCPHLASPHVNGDVDMDNGDNYERYEVPYGYVVGVPCGCHCWAIAGIVFCPFCGERIADPQQKGDSGGTRD